MTVIITIDPNVRVEKNRTYVGFEDVRGDSLTPKTSSRYEWKKLIWKARVRLLASIGSQGLSIWMSNGLPFIRSVWPPSISPSINPL